MGRDPCKFKPNRGGEACHADCEDDIPYCKLHSRTLQALNYRKQHPTPPVSVATPDPSAKAPKTAVENLRTTPSSTKPASSSVLDRIKKSFEDKIKEQEEAAAAAPPPSSKSKANSSTADNHPKSSSLSKKTDSRTDYMLNPEAVRRKEEEKRRKEEAKRREEEKRQEQERQLEEKLKAEKKKEESLRKKEAKKHEKERARQEAEKQELAREKEMAQKKAEQLERELRVKDQMLTLREKEMKLKEQEDALQRRTLTENAGISRSPNTSTLKSTNGPASTSSRASPRTSSIATANASPRASTNAQPMSFGSRPDGSVNNRGPATSQNGVSSFSRNVSTQPASRSSSVPSRMLESNSSEFSDDQPEPFPSSSRSRQNGQSQNPGRSSYQAPKQSSASSKSPATMRNSFMPSPRRTERSDDSISIPSNKGNQKKTIEVKKNAYGYYEEPETHIIFDLKSIAIGYQGPNGQFRPLTDANIRVCKRKGWKYYNLESSNDSSSFEKSGNFTSGIGSNSDLSHLSS